MPPQFGNAYKVMAKGRVFLPRLASIGEGEDGVGDENAGSSVRCPTAGGVSSGNFGRTNSIRADPNGGANFRVGHLGGICGDLNPCYPLVQL